MVFKLRKYIFFNCILSFCHLHFSLIRTRKLAMIFYLDHNQQLIKSFLVLWCNVSISKESHEISDFGRLNKFFVPQELKQCKFLS